MVLRPMTPKQIPMRVCCVLLTAAAIALSGAPRSHGQRLARPAVSPFLAVGGWTVAALRRLDALGLLESRLDLGDRTPSIAEVDRATREAVEIAQRAAPELVALAVGYRDRFEEEYPRF